MYTTASLLLLFFLVFFFIPATTANDHRFRRIFYPIFYPLHLFSYLNSWERASIFPFEWSVLNKGTTGTIFITSLVWRGRWLGIEPGTSRIRSQHYTTKAIEEAVAKSYDYTWSLSTQASLQNKKCFICKLMLLRMRLLIIYTWVYIQTPLGVHLFV